MSDPTNTPTVVLVHGGFADSSYWVPVTEEVGATFRTPLEDSKPRAVPQLRKPAVGAFTIAR